MSKRLVLFDCDGVLINTEEIGYKLVSDMLAQHNVYYSREAYVEMLSGITYEEFHAKLRREHPELPPSFQHDLRTRMKELEETQMKAIDGVKEMLQTLKDNDIPFAVCSNSGAENLIYKLKKTGLFEYFTPHIYSRHHVDNPKPAPDMYLLAAKDRGFKPEDCIVVEDTVTGTTAGVAAGMTVIGFVGEAHREDHEADMLVNAGAKMIALNPQQVWEHIADMSGKALKFPFYGVD